MLPFNNNSFLKINRFFQKLKSNWEKRWKLIKKKCSDEKEIQRCFLMANAIRGILMNKIVAFYFILFYFFMLALFFIITIIAPFYWSKCFSSHHINNRSPLLARHLKSCILDFLALSIYIYIFKKIIIFKWQAFLLIFLKPICVLNKLQPICFLIFLNLFGHLLFKFLFIAFWNTKEFNFLCLKKSTE